MAKHAVLSASSAAYWSLCPARPWLSQQCANKTTNAAAEFGTAVHWLAEFSAPADHLGEIAENGEEITETMVEMAIEYRNLLQHLINTYDLQITYQEVKVPLTTITGEPHAEGTADFVGFGNRTMVIADLKTGNVPVAAEDNKQLALYAFGAIETFEWLHEFDRVVMAIIQPSKEKGKDANFEVFECDRSELGFIVNGLKLAAMASMSASKDEKGLNAGIYCKPSDAACKYCDAMAICPALKSQLINAFDELNPPSGVSDDAALLDLWKKVPLFEKFLSAVNKHVEQRMLTGEPIEGLKIVEGREGNRQWSSEEDAAIALSELLSEEELFERKLISPTAAEKLLTEDEYFKVASLVRRKSGKPTVVIASDKRPAINSDISFDILD